MFDLWDFLILFLMGVFLGWATAEYLKNRKEKEK